MGFDALGRGYGWLAARVVRFAVLMAVVYAGVILFGLNEFRKAPVGFIPQVDQGYLIIVTQLPGGASLDTYRRSQSACRGNSLASARDNPRGQLRRLLRRYLHQCSQLGCRLRRPRAIREAREGPSKIGSRDPGCLLEKLSAIQEGLVLVIAPPRVRGIGTSGGFRMMVEDRAGRGPEALQAAVSAMMGRAAQTPGVRQVFSLFESSTPQVYLDIDRTKAQMLGINVPDVFGALQTYLGSFYVNDFNLLGRTFRVTAQAETPIGSTLRTSSRSGFAIRAGTPCRSARSPPCAT